jgi:hypothetical protein
VYVNEFIRLYPVASGEEPEGRGRVPSGWLAELTPVAVPPFHRMGTRASGDEWLTSEPETPPSWR